LQALAIPLNQIPDQSSTEGVKALKYELVILMLAGP